MGKNKLILIIVLAIIALVVVYVFDKPAPQPQTPQPGEFTDGLIELAGQEIKYKLADNATEQAVGLSNTESMAKNEGMLFAFTEPNIPSFWMKNMKFAIDIIWINGNQVVDITKNAVPEPGVAQFELKTYSPQSPANFVLEVQAGWADQFGLKIGDEVVITRIIK